MRVKLFALIVGLVLCLQWAAGASIVTTGLDVESTFKELVLSDSSKAEAVMQLSSDSIVSDAVDFRFIEQCGGVDSYRVLVYEEVAKTRPIYTLENICALNKNGTEQCQQESTIDGYEQYTEWEWVQTKDLQQGDRQYKLDADMKMGCCEYEDGKCVRFGYEVDWIPQVKLIDKTLEYPAWAWFNASFTYRANVSLNSGVNITLTNFPGYVRLNSSKLIADGKMQADCDDIRITDASDTVLYHEVENCNGDYTVVWFLAPTITTGVDNTFYIYYGNADAANVEDAFALWEGAGYASVWHGEDNTDSSGSNTMQYGGTVTIIDDPALCAFGKCWSGATNAYVRNVTFTGINNGGGIVTYSIWETRSVDAGARYDILASGAAGTDESIILLAHPGENGNGLQCNLYGRAAGGQTIANFNMSDGNLHHMSCTFDGTAAIACHNNICGNYTLGGTNSADNEQIVTQNIELATQGAGNEYIDEIRASNITRSHQWQMAEYGLVSTLHAEEGGNTRPTWNETPTDMIFDFPQDVYFRVNASDADDDALTYTINDTAFTINAATGEVNRTTIATDDYGNTWDVQLVVSDGDLTNTANITIYIYTNRSAAIGQNSFLYGKGFLQGGNATGEVNYTGCLISDIVQYVDGSLKVNLTGVDTINYSFDISLSTLTYGIGQHNVTLIAYTRNSTGISSNATLNTRFYVYNVTPKYDPWVWEGTSVQSTLTFQPNLSLSLLATLITTTYANNSITATFNNTALSPIEAFVTGGNTVNYSADVFYNILQTPTAVNKTLSWSTYWFWDSQQFNYTQEIRPVLIDNCSTYNKTAVWFYVRHEDITSMALNASVQAEVLLYGAGGRDVGRTIYLDYNVNDGVYAICMENDTATIQGDVYIKYTTTGFTHRYYAQNTTLSNSSAQNWYLYNFNDTTGLSDLQLSVRYESNYNYFPNVIVKLQRWYLGEGVWRTVQMGKSSDQGVLHFDIYEDTQDYRLVYTDLNNNILKTGSIMAFSCTGGVCSITQLLSPYAPTSTSTSIVTAITYLPAISTITLDWSDPLAGSNTVDLLVTQDTITGVYIACNTSQSGAAGSINCNMAGRSGLATVRVIANGNTTELQYINLNSSSLMAQVGSSEGAFWSVLIIITAFMFGLFSPVGAIISSFLGIMFIYFLGLFTPLTAAAVIIVAVIGIVIGFKVRS